ncbi:MAG: secondary thiamine-phosphate synthase enzyme YjbQ [Candidatus Bathyarchaeia archaeon]
MSGKGFKVYIETMKFNTTGEVDFIDITDKVADIVRRSGVRNGLAHIFAPHATALITLNEYTPDLLKDFKDLLERLAPKKGVYDHPVNAHSHLRSMLINPSRTVPIVDGRLFLGTWQSIIFIEADTHPRNRTVVVQVIGE